MTYAIEVLKDAFSSKMEAVNAARGGAISDDTSEPDRDYYRTRFIELERQAKDLERALALLTEKQEPQRPPTPPTRKG